MPMQINTCLTLAFEDLTTLDMRNDIDLKHSSVWRRPFCPMIMFGQSAMLRT